MLLPRLPIARLPTRADVAGWFLDGDIDRQSTTRDWWPIVVALASEQGGVVSRWQLTGRQVPEAVIDSWVKRGLLHVWHRGVYAVGHRALGVKGRRLAAVLACGERAGLFAQTAGDHLVVRPNASGIVHVWVPGQQGRKVNGIRPHRDSDVLPEDFVDVDGIRTANAMRVLVDMSAKWDGEALEKAFGRTELNKQFDLHTLNAIIARRPNRPGVKNLRHVMEIYDGPVPDMTALEERGLWLVKKAGLPLPLAQHHIGPHRVDFYWPDRALVMEMDSIRWHLAVQRWQNDLDRGNEHLERGIATCRFTWERAKQPESVRRLRRIYANRPPVVPSRTI
jgi:very-short-patch-repair endonuclease